MNRPLRSFVVAALIAGLVSAVIANDPSADQPARLTLDPRVTLEAVAREMNVELRPDIAAPTVHFQSSTPLSRFQDAVAEQWRFRPPVFANAYVVASNEIYLMDDPGYYRRVRRTLDESLAHEYAHFLQVHYLNADLSDPALETDAVDVQFRFRESIAALLNRTSTTAG